MKNLEPDLLAAHSPARNRRKLARAFKAVAVLLAAAVLVAAVVHFTGDRLLNRFVRPRLERAFSARLPGSSLRLGALRYDFWGDRVGCDGLTMTLPGGAPASTGSFSVTGVRWSRLLAGTFDLERLASSARIEVADLSIVLPSEEYCVRCGHLRISIPDSELAAQALTLQSIVSDETFFAAVAFRRIRYRLAVASCTLRGVGFAELLDGQAYRAQSVELANPVLESLIDREKPRRPLTAGPPMPHEVLAAIKKPFRIGRVTITDGLIRYATRRSAAVEPGVLTFTAVQITAKDIANAAAGGQVIGILAEGRLMDAGTMTVQMRIPVAPTTLTFHYSGKLNAMDLTRLDEYMDGAGRIQIRSGIASEASFDIDVVGGHAQGVMRGAYRDLQVRVLDGDTGSEKGVTNRVATILANHLKVRHENTPDKAGASREGKVDYARTREESFLQFAWLALRSGILDLSSL